MKVILHPTWRCPLRCSYCSVHAQGLERDTAERPWHDWAAWTAQLPRRSHIEISGGEPLAYAGLLDLLRAIGAQGHDWGLTTNAVPDAVWALAEARLVGSVAVNVSVQPQSPPDLADRIRALGAAYSVHVNHVEHPASPPVPDLAVPVNRIPYQAWAEGAALDGVRRVCDAGTRHLCTDPAGRLYRCLVELQSGAEPLGTIDMPIGEIVTAGEYDCDHGCTTCYTDNPAAWEVNMREGS